MILQFLSSLFTKLSYFSFFPDGWGIFLLIGLFITILLAVTAFPIAMLLGLGIAVSRRSPETSLRISCTIFTSLFRALPELLTLFLVYYGAGMLLDMLATRYDFFPHINVNRFLAGVIALSLVSSAYISEVFLAAFQSIPHGQYEAAYALGLPRFVITQKIIFPQLIRHALPGLSNIWLILLKDTSLVSVIGLTEILYRAQLAQRSTNETFLFYFFTFLVFLLLTFLSSKFISLIQKWADRGQNLTIITK